MAKALCGHVNMHSLDTNGKPDNLKCVLEKGHEGLHEAPHFERATQLSHGLAGGEADEFDMAVDEKGRTWYEGTITRQWSDAAGIPAKDIKPSNPGEHLVQSPEMFPEYQGNEVKNLRKELDELKALLKEKADAKA